MQLHDFLGRLQERSNLHSQDEALSDWRAANR